MASSKRYQQAAAVAVTVATTATTPSTGGATHVPTCVVVSPSVWLFWGTGELQRWGWDASLGRVPTIYHQKNLPTPFLQNHLEERLLDQAQARASYTPPPLFLGSFA